jgi:light-regulated signal transduction histidine kinase (bacteriophytochrome)
MRFFIDDLLRYAHATHADRQVTALDGEALLQKALIALDEAVVSSGAKISHDPLPTVTADAGIEYVLQNLISNAIKYHRERVVPEIHISAREDADSWVFSVADNGIGIDSRNQEKIFGIFCRLHGSDIPGNGIGLALSQKIIQAHQGAIWVESEPGAGSKFFFTLPKHAD